MFLSSEEEYVFILLNIGLSLKNGPQSIREREEIKFRTLWPLEIKIHLTDASLRVNSHYFCRHMWNVYLFIVFFYKVNSVLRTPFRSRFISSRTLLLLLFIFSFYFLFQYLSLFNVLIIFWSFTFKLLQFVCSFFFFWFHVLCVIAYQAGINASTILI